MTQVRDLQCRPHADCMPTAMRSQFPPHTSPSYRAWAAARLLAQAARTPPRAPNNPILGPATNIMLTACAILPRLRAKAG